MVEPKPPRQVALVISQFPKESWAATLVNAINQFSLEVVQSFRATAVKYKTLSFATGATVADSFPIDFPVTEMPQEVRVAQAPGGANAVTVKWSPIATPGLAVRVDLITGLSSDTSYSIRLAYQ